ncbi:MAG TPA: hypothetical protein VGC46_09290, partial [Allosphingosinicella sp.]
MGKWGLAYGIRQAGPVILAVLATLPAAAAAQDQQLTLQRVFASPSLSGAAPRLPKLSPDGRYATM